MSPSVTARESLPAIIAARAEARIRSGEWAPGSRLPPERELCRLLAVSRSTLRLALDELEARGLVTRHQGRGTFVARRPIDADASGYFTLSTALRAHGAELETRVLGVSVSRAGPLLAEELDIGERDEVVRIERLRLLHGEPLILEAATLPLDPFPGLPEADLERRSLYDVLREDHGRDPVAATETLEPVIVTAREASLLGVRRGAAALLVRRATADASGATIELATALLRGDRSRFLLRRRIADGQEPIAWPPSPYAFEPAPVADLDGERGAA